MRSFFILYTWRGNLAGLKLVLKTSRTSRYGDRNLTSPLNRELIQQVLEIVSKANRAHLRHGDQDPNSLRISSDQRHTSEV